MAKRTQAEGKRLATRKKLIRWAALAPGVGLVLVMALFLAVYLGLFGRLATVEELQRIQNHISSEVYSSDHVLLGKYYIQDRTNVAYQDLPAHLIEALIATEDARFYEHNGIDSRSVLRVAFKSLLLRNRSAGGGSTIHQQLAKNLYPRRSIPLIGMPVNKFREMILAVRIHQAYFKEEILELYLNTVSFGENTYGIETASQRFFSKQPRYLQRQESAMLVGMLKGTSSYNPRKHPEKALARRNLVFSQMQRYGYLDMESRDSLCSLPLELDYKRLTHNEGLAPYFREHLRQELTTWAKEQVGEEGRGYNIYTDGLRIHTTINSDLQAYAEQAMRQHMSHLQAIFDRQWKQRSPDIYAGPLDDSLVEAVSFLHAGLLSMEAETGYVRAWVGGIDSRYFKYDHVSSKRQPGSTFKPLLYSAALESGRDPCEYIANDSVVYEDYDDWTPRNSHGGYGGYYSMKGALTHSVNTVSVKLLEETGIEEVIDLAGRLGIEGPLPEVLSLALGTGDVSLMEMVRAYSIFPNQGRMVEPVYIHRIEDKTGKILYESETRRSEPVVDPHTALMMTGMMKSVVDSGTASSLRTLYGFENEMAGKTGTTQNNSDGWFIGYTPALITGVWVGGEHPDIRFKYGGYGQGAYAALPIWARYMQRIYRDPLYSYSRNLSFEIPEEVLWELDCEDYLDEDHPRSRRFDRRKNDFIRRFFRRFDRNKRK